MPGVCDGVWSRGEWRSEVQGPQEEAPSHLNVNCSTAEKVLESDNQAWLQIPALLLVGLHNCSEPQRPHLRIYMPHIMGIPTAPYRTKVTVMYKRHSARKVPESRLLESLLLPLLTSDGWMLAPLPPVRIREDRLDSPASKELFVFKGYI